MDFPHIFDTSHAYEDIQRIIDLQVFLVSVNDNENGNGKEEDETPIILSDDHVDYRWIDVNRALDWKEDVSAGDLCILEWLDDEYRYA